MIDKKIIKNCGTLIVFLIILLLFASCAAGPNPFEDTTYKKDKTAGFWCGLWHGMISGITFIISLFSDKVHFYEVHNNGGWYNFGFAFGTGILFGGVSRSVRKRSRR